MQSKLWADNTAFDGRDLYVVVLEQRFEPQAPVRMVLDDQESLVPLLGVALDPSERGLEAGSRRRLGDERERAARKSRLPLFVDGDDLDRYVSSLRIAFELAQHGPSEHVGQEQVERDRGRLVCSHEAQCLGAAHAHDDLEPALTREVHHQLRILRVVLDDEQARLAWTDVVAIVQDGLHRRVERSRRREVGGSDGVDFELGRRDVLRSRIGQRQVERERAAFSERAAQSDLATQQLREFTADRQAEAGAAVLPARGRIGLLERLEYEPLLVERDPDPGVRHGKCDHARGRVQGLVLRAPARGRARHAERHTAFRSELERVREQVLEHLLKALRIGHDRVADPGVDLELE